MLSELLGDVDQIDERMVLGIERVALTARARTRFDEQAVRQPAPSSRTTACRAGCREDCPATPGRGGLRRNRRRRVRALAAVLTVVEAADLVLRRRLPREANAAARLRRIGERGPVGVRLVGPGRGVERRCGCRTCRRRSSRSSPSGRSRRTTADRASIGPPTGGIDVVGLLDAVGRAQPAILEVLRVVRPLERRVVPLPKNVTLNVLPPSRGMMFVCTPPSACSAVPAA